MSRIPPSLSLVLRAISLTERSTVCYFILRVNKTFGILAVLTITIAIPATVLISLNQQNTQQNAAGPTNAQLLIIPTVSPAPPGCHYKVTCPSRCSQHQCLCSATKICQEPTITP